MLEPSSTRSPDSSAGVARYNPVARALHWTTALVIFTILPLGWVAVHMAKDAPGRDGYFFLHKSFGLLALALIIARLVWRSVRQPPKLPPRMAQWEKALAHTTHFFIYAIFIIMPVSGYILSSAGGHGVSFFGLFSLPMLPKDKAVSEFANNIHMWGQFAVYVFLAAHVVGVIWHVAYRKDGYIERMLPAQINAE